MDQYNIGNVRPGASEGVRRAFGDEHCTKGEMLLN